MMIKERYTQLFIYVRWQQGRKTSFHEKNNKIESIPSYSKLRKEIEGADSLRKFVKFLSLFGIRNIGQNTILTRK